MNRSKIEWTKMTYNPWAGCSKVSPGCLNCYAERMARRLKAMGVPHYQDVVDENGWTGIVRPRPGGWFERLPGERAAPKMIFVGSMTDIFHERASDAAIRELFFHMLASGGHNTFQILTKRVDRAVEFFDQHFDLGGNPKFWIGVSVCNQEEAEEKIPELLKINAAVRFVSVEPMLGPVDLPSSGAFGCDCDNDEQCLGTCSYSRKVLNNFTPAPRGLDWVICGGESGPGARPMHPDWARKLRDQCVAAGVPFFFKQWGEWAEVGPLKVRQCMVNHRGVSIDYDDPEFNRKFYDAGTGGAQVMYRVGKKKAGRELDGKVWDQLPALRPWVIDGSTTKVVVLNPNQRVKVTDVERNDGID